MYRVLLRIRFLQPKITRPQGPEGASNLLGIVGVGCIVVAAILLIKFSIDSGWLTPARQLFISALFGGSLIAVPFLSNDRGSYLSQMPATGIIVLHLTLYGAIYYHQLIDPGFGIWGVWAISLLSLWLLSVFKHDIFAIMSIAGTYVGSFILRNSFDDLRMVAGHLIVWDIVFVMFAIKLRNRSLISIAAYFSLGSVAFMMFTTPAFTTSDVLPTQSAILQLIQILIFSLATATYTMQKKKTT